MPPRKTPTFLWKWQRAHDGQVILSSLILYNVGLDSRFGAELVQSVSLLSGQGHCLAASEETDPLTVDHCCGGQAGRIQYIQYVRPGNEEVQRTITESLQQDTGLIYAALFFFFLPVWNDFSSRSVQFYGEAVFFFSIFRAIFHEEGLLLSVSGAFYKEGDICDPQILIIFLHSLEIINQRGIGEVFILAFLC